MALLILFSYTPVLSYALTEETEGIDDAAAEATEDLTAPEVETEESEEYTEDSAMIESLVHGLEPSENESVLSERKALKLRVAPAGSKAASDGSENVVAINAYDTRIYGQTRYDTAVTVANQEKSESEKFKNVIVADGENYPDALSGGYLAKLKNAPILLVHSSVENDIVNYIEENIEPEGTVYILGGTGAVSSAFESKIKAKGILVDRLGGRTRYDTNLKILEEARKEAGTDSEGILVCTGEGYADSLSASAVGEPILLVENTLSDAQKEYIQSLSTEKFYLIGGEGAVVPEIESDLISLEISEDNIDRLWGATRFETSIAVADRFFKNTETVVLAYAWNFPDGLSGGPFAMQKGAPIILTDSNTTEPARAYVERSGGFFSFTLGGASLISDNAVWIIMGRSPYIKPEKKYARVQVGETVEIWINSNWGTKADVKDENKDVIEIVSKGDPTYNKGTLSECYTVKGEQAGTAVLVLTDSYSGLATDSVTVVVTDGDASVKTLYSIIETTGYVNRNGDKTVKHTVDGKSVYFVNHSDNVEMVCVVGDISSYESYTTMTAPLETHDIYPATIINGEITPVVYFETDINPGQYTSSTELTIKNSTDPEDISFVNSTFRRSMATWNSVVEKNYGLTMNDLGFTNY